MRIRFVSKATDWSASHRMRAVIPAEVLASHYPEHEVDLAATFDPNADVNIFMKHFAQDQMNEEARLLREGPDPGSHRIHFDICDDHWSRPFRDHYLRWCALADTVSVNTLSMGVRLSEVSERSDFSVVNDPITFPFYKWEESTRSRIYRTTRKPEDLSILWFGHATNLEDALKWFEVDGQWDITIVSNVDTNPRQGTRNRFGKQLIYHKWRPGYVEALMPFFDCVILPVSLTGRPYAAHKSPNRAVDALHSGRYVLTDCAPIYGSLQDYIWIGNIKEGLNHYIEDLESCRKQVSAGQDHVIGFYNHKRIAEQWLRAIT